MDANFLPDSVKERLTAAVGNRTPTTILRGGGGLDGQAGESYLIAFEDEFLVFSKGFNSGETSVTHVHPADLQGVLLRRGEFHDTLTLNVNNQPMTLNLSRGETQLAEPLIKRWESMLADDNVDNRPATPPPIPHQTASHDPGTPPPIPPQQPAGTPPPIPAQTNPATTTIPKPSFTPPPIPGGDAKTEPPALSPLAALAAALMRVAACDDEIAQDEDDCIRRICLDNHQVLSSGLDFFKNHDYDELLNVLSELDHQQQLCVLANMIELGMSDGVLHSVEQRIIRRFIDASEITDEEHQAIRDVLLVKNQVSILCD